MTRKGIDVSHWQGTIDWNKVKKAGIEFAIIKVGGSDAGFYTDSKWEANYKGAKAAGIPIGAYYFVGKDCVTASAGKADAERFLQILKGRRQHIILCQFDKEKAAVVQRETRYIKKRT